MAAHKALAVSVDDCKVAISAGQQRLSINLDLGKVEVHAADAAQQQQVAPGATQLDAVAVLGLCKLHAGEGRRARGTFVPAQRTPGPRAINQGAGGRGLPAGNALILATAARPVATLEGGAHVILELAGARVLASDAARSNRCACASPPGRHVAHPGELLRSASKAARPPGTAALPAALWRALRLRPHAGPTRA